MDLGELWMRGESSGLRSVVMGIMGGWHGWQRVEQCGIEEDLNANLKALGGEGRVGKRGGKTKDYEGNCEVIGWIVMGLDCYWWCDVMGC